MVPASVGSLSFRSSLADGLELGSACCHAHDCTCFRASSASARAQIALAGAATDRDDQLALVLRTLRHLQRRPDVRAGRNAGQDPFFQRQPPRRGKGVLVADRDDVVHDLQIEVLGHKARPRALNLVRTRLERFAIARLRDDRRILRLDRDGPERLLARLDHLADARDRAAGADRRDQDVRLAVGVLPNLLGRGPPVNLRVGGVVELLRNPRVGDFLVQVLRLLDRPFHALGGRRQDQLRPQQRQQGAPLHAHALRHRQDELVALGGRHERQRDPGVARGRLDDRGLGREDALALGGGDHRVADPVLHAAQRVEELALQRDGGHRAVGDAVEFDQRGSPHCADDVWIYWHDYLPFFVD